MSDIIEKTKNVIQTSSDDFEHGLIVGLELIELKSVETRWTTCIMDL